MISLAEICFYFVVFPRFLKDSISTENFNGLLMLLPIRFDTTYFLSKIKSKIEWKRINISAIIEFILQDWGNTFFGQ